MFLPKSVLIHESYISLGEPSQKLSQKVGKVKKGGGIGTETQKVH